MLDIDCYDTNVCGGDCDDCALFQDLTASQRMPKNCTTCGFHRIRFDGCGFDGCTCNNFKVRFSDSYHRYCDEFCDFDFNTETDDGLCPHWAVAEQKEAICLVTCP